MAKVFASGPLAGAVYGSDLHGVSDRELLTLRRMAMSRVKPSAQGRPLSVLCFLEGTTRGGPVVPLSFAGPRRCVFVRRGPLSGP
eukprot:151932-Pyramimonas_sp.AAC.1